ncbi:3' terminal RNA ribose 2'-O-methyltransferase Hen1 [Yinghuangia sp. ASG 101]|uniref:3' terminal RNA ribose 2'-O-methyltransferase Hen1 n=1 Tax=Yinghuangia sp. ASG 101 TaxID=2896848 RepID=UPI001E659CD2|nr:3' terminal RNA ribose 2'-O-methyltransferase Hen1 [Yinghuangia sp. ASG 101]UGQ13836.1 3' terminal RNA ribose 2'-O-methyltransferase Hen1 [Yinghuangia sp. ASG 101]
MFLTIATTRSPATDLGFLLHKHPDKSQQFGSTYGTAHVFYPEASHDRCEAALLLDVDPVGLVRGSRKSGGAPDFALAQYVNDRPYAASSLLAVALGGVFRTAMRGRCEARPELVDQEWPLDIAVPAVPSRGGAAMVRSLFEPLGWAVDAEPVALDGRFPEWGESRYVRLRLTGTFRVSRALRHLYVLLPVLDDAKHYWVSPEEVDKLLRAGEGWLADHPERTLITRRYLSRRPGLTRTALERLAEVEEVEAEGFDNAVPRGEEDDAEEGSAENPRAEEERRAGSSASPSPTGGLAASATDPVASPGGRAPQATCPAASATALPGSATALPGSATGLAASASDPTVSAADPAPAGADAPMSLAEHRRRAVLAVLRRTAASRVLDLGCGDGKLLGELLKERRFAEVVGVDVSVRALGIAARRLRLDRMGERQRARIRLMQGALTYTDARLAGYDAAVLSEVIEHIDEPRLPALEFAVFGAARPTTVVVTTPNAEYNVRYAPDEAGGPGLAPGAMRHADHRFEWGRARFRSWADDVGERFGYQAEFVPVGDDDPEVGPPTQMAVFTAHPAADSDTEERTA